MRRFPVVPVLVVFALIAAGIFALSRVDSSQQPTRVETPVPENALAR